MATVPWSVASGGQTSAPLYSDVAIAGLKYCLDFDLTVTLAYSQTDIITPGIVLCQLANGTGAIPSVAYAQSTTLVPYGIFVRDALSDHQPVPSYFPPLATASGVAVSMMQRGAIWAQVTAGATCTAHGPVRFDNNGLVSDTGNFSLPHAIFLTAATQLQSGSSIVVVGLQSPMAS